MFEPVEELRLLSRLDRNTMVALGAVLSAAGIALGCREAAPVAIYGAPAPPEQVQPAPSAAPPPEARPAPSAVKPLSPSAPPLAPAAAYGAPPPLRPPGGVAPNTPLKPDTEH